jgi:hypothetical protein
LTKSALVGVAKLRIAGENCHSTFVLLWKKGSPAGLTKEDWKAEEEGKLVGVGLTGVS